MEEKSELAARRDANIIKKVAEQGRSPTSAETATLVRDTQTRLEAHKDEALTPEGVKAVEDTKKLIGDTKHVLMDKGVSQKLAGMVEHGWKAAQDVGAKLPDEIERGLAAPVRKERLVSLLRAIGNDVSGLSIELAYSSTFRAQFRELFSLIYSFLTRKEPEILNSLQQYAEKGTQFISDKIQALKLEEKLPVVGGPIAEKAKEMLGVDKERDIGEEITGKVKGSVQSLRAQPTPREGVPDYSGAYPPISSLELPGRFAEKESGVEGIERVERAQGIEAEEGLIKPELAERVIGEMPEELNELNMRLNKILTIITGNERYKRLVNHLIQLFNELKEGGETLANLIQVESTEAVETQNFKMMWNDAKQLVDTFAPGKLDNLINSVLKLWYEIKDERDLMTWFPDFTSYVQNLLNNPELLKDSTQISRGKELLMRGRTNLDYTKHQRTLDDIQNSFKDLIVTLENDPALSALQADINRLVSDFVVVDKNTGAISYKWEALNDMRRVLQSILSEQLMYVPIPTIAGEQEGIEYKIKSGTIKGTEILPDKIVIEARQIAELNLETAVAEKMGAWLKVVIKGMTLQMNDVNFWFKKNTFPSMEDEGIAQLEAKNATVVMTILLTKEGSFIVRQVDCDIDKLNIHVDRARHDVLLNIYTTLWSTSLRHKFEWRVENLLTKFLHLINMLMSTTVNSLKMLSKGDTSSISTLPQQLKEDVRREGVI